MAKKRKSENNGLDEVERTMYTTFCTAANSLSQLYSQGQQQQKMAFQAGERQALERMFQWMLRQQELGSRVVISDIFSYLQEMYTVVKEFLWIQTCSKILPLLPFHLPPGDRRQCGFLQNELDNGGDGVSILPGSQYQHHSPGQQANHFSTPSSETIPEEGAQSTIGLSPRLGYSDQNKNNVFSNSLASPVQRSLPPFHIAQNGYSCANNALEVEYGGRRAGFAMDLNRGGFHGGHASGSPQHAEIKGVNYIPCQMGAPVHTYGQQPLHDSINKLFSQNDSHMDTHADGSAYGLYQRG